MRDRRSQTDFKRTPAMPFSPVTTNLLSTAPTPGISLDTLQKKFSDNRRIGKQARLGIARRRAEALARTNA